MAQFHGRKAEVPLTTAEGADDESFPFMTNRRQMLLFVALTLILTVVTVWGTRAWFKRSDTLVFATADINGIEAKFATKLAAALKNNGSKLRIRMAANADSPKALAQFDRKQADLAILRTDQKVPSRARAVAILERDMLLLITPGAKKSGSLARLKKKKIAVIGDGDNNDVFVRKALDISENSDAATRVQPAAAGTTLDKLLSSGSYGAVIAIVHASKMVKDKSYEQLAKRPGGFKVNAIDEADTITRKNPGIFDEKINTGMLSSSPVIPDDDVDTIGLQWLLVAQSKMSPAIATELARVLYENKADLALDDGFASKIEAADTDKDAFVVAHAGAAQYINDDTKSFIERYSDLIYLGVAALSVIGSIFLGIYTKLTRIAPEKASQLATAILDIGEKVHQAGSIEAIEKLQDELEAILRGVVVGLRDGTISSDGLDTFRLGYEFVRDEIEMRRESLRRHGNHEDNVVIVKTA